MKSTLTDFFQNFKVSTEKQWEGVDLNPETFGYQIQPNTKWKPGHSLDEVNEIFSLTKIDKKYHHQDLLDLLLLTQGHDVPQINVQVEGDRKYAYTWKLNINYIRESWNAELQSLKNRGEIQAIEDIVQTTFVILPIFGHRYIVITENSLIVYSIWNKDDIIIYGDSLQEYLQHEFLVNGSE